MNQDKIFVLAYSDWEEYEPHIFIGSEFNSEDAFQELCDSLVDKAAADAIDNEKSKDYSSWVGWNDIVKAMIPLLEEQGYIHVVPKIKVYNGPGIIKDLKSAKVLGHDAAAQVIRYNEEVEKEHRLSFK